MTWDIMFVKQCHKPPRWIDGVNKAHKNGKIGDGFAIALLTWQVIVTSAELTPKLMASKG